MNFGDPISGMISSLKNNKRDKKSVFEKTKNYKESNNKLIFDKKASLKDLKIIRTKLQKQNKINTYIRRTIYLIVTILGILLFIWINQW